MKHQSEVHEVPAGHEVVTPLQSNFKDFTLVSVQLQVINVLSPYGVLQEPLESGPGVGVTVI